MVVTNEYLNDYDFKNSPDCFSDDSLLTDYFDITSNEDFLEQLSSGLDIPLYLNQGEDEMNLLNSFLDRSPEEIMSEVASPVSESKLDDLKIEINELQQLDLTQWGPEAFPNLKSEIKTENSDEYHSDSTNSDSTSSSQASGKSPPPSPLSNASSPRSIHSTNNCVKIVPKPATQLKIQNEPEKQIILCANKSNVNKNKRKAPLMPLESIHVPKSELNFNFVNTSTTTASKVVVLENVSIPSNKVSTVPTVTSITSAGTVVPITLPVVVNASERVSMNYSVDIKALKRQQRMIKNRESACLSRKKKKDYVTSLEQQVQDLTSENQQLKLENAQLKERLEYHENKTRTRGKTVTNSIALCLVLFVVAVNVNFLRNPSSTNIFISNVKQQETLKKSEYHGRNLLWILEENNKSSSAFPMCPIHVNQTENARLASELHRWIGEPYNISLDSYKNENTHVRLRKSKLRSTRLRNRNSLSTPFVSSISKMGRKNRKYVEELSNNELQVFSPNPEQLYSEFFEAINRQDDTFYVVSLSAHHMLLPALNHNKTRRPKMSLIMPSVLLNDTTSLQMVPLMQIDCEVLDTRLIHVKNNAIPQHLRNEGNVTQPSAYSTETNVSGVSEDAEKKYKNATQHVPYLLQNSVDFEFSNDKNLTNDGGEFP